MGLGTILWMAVFGGSAIKAGLQNLDCKANSMQLPNGVEYYLDRVGTARLMNGDIINFWGDGTVRHNKTRKIIYDPKAVANQEAVDKVKPYQKYHYAQQNHDRCEYPATVDLDTGRVVAQVEERLFDDGHVEYRKWYLYDCYEEKYGKGNCGSCIRINPDTIRYGDPGILITEEEFNAINTCPKVYLFYFHKLIIDGEWDKDFTSFSPCYLEGESESFVKEEIEIGKEWKRKGHGDGWYGTNHDIYVKDGMVVSKKLKNKNGETYTGFPYERKVGGRFVKKVVSYESYLRIMNNENIPLRNKVWFR